MEIAGGGLHPTMDDFLPDDDDDVLILRLPANISYHTVKNVLLTQ